MHILRRNNEPYQSYVDRGYFSVSTLVIQNAVFTKTVSTTPVTQRGLQWLIGVFTGKDKDDETDD